jgi:hypothetical protein
MSNASNPAKTIALLAALACAGAYVYVFSGVGKQITAQCQANRLGEGNCQFTNMGWTAGTSCVHVGLKNRFTSETVGTETCSGRVWPKDSVRREISFVVPTNHCGLMGTDWESTCEFFVRQADADADADADAEQNSSAGSTAPAAAIPALAETHVAAPEAPAVHARPEPEVAPSSVGVVPAGLDQTVDVRFGRGETSFDWAGPVGYEKSFAIQVAEGQDLSLDSGDVYTWSLMDRDGQKYGCNGAEYCMSTPDSTIRIPHSGRYVIQTSYRLSDCADCEVSPYRDVTLKIIVPPKAQ